MKKTTTAITAIAESEIQNYTDINDVKFHLTLRDSKGTLLAWHIYKGITAGASAFKLVKDKMEQVYEEHYHFANPDESRYEYLAFETSTGERISLVRDNPRLTIEIFTNTPTLTLDLFNDILDGVV